MLKQIKNLMQSYLRKMRIAVAYTNDYKEYSKWQYNNPKVKTKNALEARILRQTHIIEKGMSLSEPKSKFGVQKAKDLLDYISDYVERGFLIEDSTHVKNAIGVIGAYLEFHKKRGFIPTDIVNQYNVFLRYTSDKKESYGIKSITIEELQRKIHSEFPDFFSSRHSVRQFADKPVSCDDILKAVEVAVHAPSACNRQSVKVYFYEDTKINLALGDLIAGNTGFDKEVPNYLVITSDLSSFYDAFERNQVYVDGGIFCMALIEALHYYGIASCVLQNGEFKDRNLQFKKICGNIPENEKIIMFIAIGYYKERVTYAISHRKELREILKIK